ncbi:hypothetical protein PMIN07_008846 [Paraphaeosphaeria minitans]
MFALCTGVDFPGIVFVLHESTSPSMIDFCQEGGRPDRSGKVASSVIIVEPGEVETRLQQGGELADVCTMGIYIQNNGCRRDKISEYTYVERVECSDVDSAGWD